MISVIPIFFWVQTNHEPAVYLVLKTLRLSQHKPSRNPVSKPLLLSKLSITVGIVGGEGLAFTTEGRFAK